MAKEPCLEKRQDRKMNWGMRRRVPDDLRKAQPDPATIPEHLKRVIGRAWVSRSYGPVSHAQAVVRHRREMAAVDVQFAEARRWLAGQGIEVRHAETGGLPVALPQVEPTLADCQAAILSWFHGQEVARVAQPVPTAQEAADAAAEAHRWAALKFAGGDDATADHRAEIDREAEAIRATPLDPHDIEAAFGADAAVLAGEEGRRTADRQLPAILGAYGFAAPVGEVRRLAVAMLQHALVVGVKRDGDRWMGRPEVAHHPAFASVTTFSAAPKAPTATLTFGGLIDRYMSAPERAALSPKTVLKYKAFSRVLREIVGETKAASSVDRAACRDAQAVLLALPANAVKRWPALTAQQAAEKAKAEGVAPMHVKSVGNHLDFLSAVFGWGAREQLVEKNPASGLNTSTAKGVTSQASGEKRRPFEPEELAAIFSAPLYTGCQDDGNGYDKPGPRRPRRGRFWVPLLSLFGGLRLNEACQIRVADVVTVDGVHLIQVRAEGEGARLKTAAAERRVPVHPELVRLGFLQHVEKQRQAGEDRLFPDLRLGKMGTYSDPFSKWFGRFLTKAKVTAPGAVFHSFRHGWRDRLRNCGRPNKEIADALGGWAATGEGSNYGSGFSATVLANHLAQVAYPGLDLAPLYGTGGRRARTGQGSEGAAPDSGGKITA